MEHIFIINPTAGQGKAEKLIPKIEEAMEGLELTYSIYTTTAGGDAERFVKETCEKGEDVRFYVCGGDGSLHEAVNGAKGFSNAEIGLLPVGTGNDFVRNFGRQKDFMDISAQVNGESFYSDVIEINGRYAVNMANIGFDCDVVAKAAEWKKKPLIKGPFAYVMGIMSMLVKPIGNWMSFRLGDGTKLTGRFLLCTIANGRFCGGGFCSSPLATVEDGLMDVGIVSLMTRRKFIGILPKYKTGEYLDTKLAAQKVLYERMNRLEIAVPEPMHISIDGEISEFTYMKAEIVPKAFRFILPAGLPEMEEAEKEPETEERQEAE